MLIKSYVNIRSRHFLERLSKRHLIQQHHHVDTVCVFTCLRSRVLCRLPLKTTPVGNVSSVHFETVDILDEQLFPATRIAISSVCTSVHHSFGRAQHLHFEFESAAFCPM